MASSPYCLDSTGHIIAFIVFYIFYVLFIAICGYGTYKIYCQTRSKHNISSFIYARHLSSTYLLMNCVDLLIIQPTHCLLLIFSMFDGMYLSITIVADVRFILFGFFFSARIWLLHFDYHFGKECIALLFRSKHKNNFYLNHRHTFGAPKRVILATVVLILFCILILDVLPLILGISMSLTDCIRIPIYLIEGILLITLYHKVQSIDDKFKIRLEIMLIVCIPGLFAFIYMLFEIILTMQLLPHHINECDFFYIYCYFMLIIIALTVMIETILPLQLHKNQSRCVQHTLAMIRSSKANGSTRIRFRDILGSQQGLLLFVEHLETEFSVENILFLVFIAKYREYYMSQIIPSLLSKHKYLLQKNNGASEDESSTTKDGDRVKTIVNITPRTPELFDFDKQHTITPQETPQCSVKVSPITPRPNKESLTTKCYKIAAQQEQKQQSQIVMSIEEVRDKHLGKMKRADSNVSDSCLRTPIPGSFKHSPMIIDEEILHEGDVFCLDELETDSEDGTEYLEYKRGHVRNWTVASVLSVTIDTETHDQDSSIDSKEDLIHRTEEQRQCASPREMENKRKGKLNADYSSVATVIGTRSKGIKTRHDDTHVRRGYSVDFNECETQKEMKKLSILRSIFGHKKNLNLSVDSTAEPSPRTEKSMKFSTRINYESVRSNVDFELQCNIGTLVEPLTQKFIPTPTAFNNVSVKEAAKHIFEQFVDDGAPYQINISHECRSRLQWLFEEEKYGSMSELSFIFLFDSAFYEIYITVTSDSFLRFKSSRKFVNFLNNGHLKEMPHQREDSQWSFNASFVEFNSSLGERTDNEPSLPKHAVQLAALPSGQPVQ
eukprot:197451_1